jgi:hypothetical protein
VLYQLSYSPIQAAASNKVFVQITCLLQPAKYTTTLLRFAVHGVLAAVSAVFLQFHAARVIPAVLLRCVIAFLALGAGHGNDWADIFLFGCHFLYLWLPG